MATPSTNLNIPGFNGSTPITDKGDRPSQLFISWIGGILSSIVGAINNNTALLNIVQQQQAILLATQQASATAQAAASSAQASADAAGGTGAVSGNAQGTIDFQQNFVTAATVSLTGVTAGNLTISGSGPQQAFNTDFSQTNTNREGNWQVVEVQGALRTVVFTGTFNVSKYYDGEFQIQQIYLYNDTDATALTAPIARTSTGAMDYELQLILPGSPVATVYNVIGALYVRRS
jgi:hypothetical protein